MTWTDEPVANGLRTDHPWPNLPFVDDSHIPIQDPDAVEGLGRGAGGGLWGRCDHDERTGEWAAFTTDPKNHDFAWVLRFHPRHGLSVLLYHDDDAAGAYDEWFSDKALLTRLGGYWWDGTTWYRPRQVMNWATEHYMRRPVQRPTVISAADLLDDSCRPERGTVAKIVGFTPRLPVPPQQWRHDLARWAEHRTDGPDVLALEQCVVTLNAPELAETGLLGVEEFAAEAGIAASTLRAYIARGEADIPPPQTSDGGRKRWSRPVVTDWLERRRRAPDNAAAALAGDPTGAASSGSISPALRRLWDRLTSRLLRELWEQPAVRRRFARPFRNEHAAKELAEQLGWVAAVNADAAIPVSDLAWMIQQSVLWELHRFRELQSAVGYISLTRQAGHALGWFIEQAPGRTLTLFGAIVRDAGNILNIPAEVVEKSLRQSLVLNGGLSAERVDEFFAVTFPPQK